MRIKVKKGTQIMWVTNPKNIVYWKNRARDCASRSILKGSDPDIKILKEVKD